MRIWRLEGLKQMTPALHTQSKWPKNMWRLGNASRYECSIRHRGEPGCDDVAGSLWGNAVQAKTQSVELNLGIRLRPRACDTGARHR